MHLTRNLVGLQVNSKTSPKNQVEKMNEFFLSATAYVDAHDSFGLSTEDHETLLRRKVFQQFLYPARPAPIWVGGGIGSASDLVGSVVSDASLVHHQASGDFFLAHRGAWHAMRGYAEFVTSSHTDSHLCLVAAAVGLKQVIFVPPLRIWHQPHSK